jgi:exopolysaccharide biosynthesis WecB/TagA/CpsF family protein
MDTDGAVAVLAARDPALPFVPFVTPNLEHAYWRREEAEVRTAHDEAVIATNDSRILHRLALWAGLEIEFAPGAYVVEALFRTVIRPDEPITIIGCPATSVASLKARYGLTAVAHHWPPMGFIHDDAAVRTAIEFVLAHPARFVFIAMGPPQSEMFCVRVARAGGAVGIGLCIGSSLSTLTGETPPAPRMLETTGLVWVYRLAREPGRLWRRYLVRGRVGLSQALGEILAARLRRRPARV